MKSILSALLIGAVSLIVLFVLNSDATIDMSNFRVEVVSRSEEQKIGLSGRKSIDNNFAMVFDFGAEGTRCMWMKDMSFSIDMLWLDAQKRIIQRETNVSPKTYPMSLCADGAAYVIEVAAGVAESSSMLVGRRVAW